MEACVDERYACGSDHEPILTGGKRLGRYSMEKLDPEEFGRICAREATNLTWNANAEELERLKDQRDSGPSITSLKIYKTSC